MGSMRRSLALIAVAVFAGGCQILNYSWATPTSVPAGRVFTMELTGQTTSIQGTAGVVFQVPNGFTVLGASATPPSAAFARDEPSLLSLYTPDANHHLASFSGFALGAGTINVAVKVYVQAPVTAGTYQLEMALASLVAGAGFTPQLGLGSFQAPGGSATRTLVVSAVPAPPPFALHSGLFDVLPAAVNDLECADIDRDGRADLVVLGYAVTISRSIPGGFSPLGVTIPTVAGDFRCTVADFDGDGFADVAMGSGTVRFGDGGATWTPVVAAAHGMAEAAIAAGDVDGDGVDDVAFAELQRIVVCRGQPNRTFVPWSQGLPVGGSTPVPCDIQVVDLDADGRAELVVSSGAVMTTGGVYRSTPAGAWNLVGSLPATGHVLVIDVDGNGTKELLPGGTNQLFTYSPAGLTSAPFAGPGTFARAAALDYDRDGRVDIALAVTAAQPHMELWRNVGGGVFQAVPLPTWTGFQVLYDSRQLLAADFDDDTFPDLCANIDRVLVWHNTQQGTAPFGEPCSAPGFGVPDLFVQGSVAPGQSGALQLGNAGPLGSTLLWVGPSRTAWSGQPVLPFDLGVFGAPGCAVLAEPFAIVGATANGAGVASVPFTVPPFPPYAESTLFAQGAVLAPGANPLGVLFSRGLALKMQ